MAAQTEIPPFSVPTCPQCGTHMLIVRNSQEWPSYLLRTYACPWCPHKMSQVIRSVALAIDQTEKAATQ
jgi:Zn finger protein HypA/HybF involved in hydrogenase expression